MTQSEYERRRRFLEEQLQAALNMVRSGYEVAFRALEALREERAGGERNGAKAAPKTRRPASAQPRRSRLPANQWPADLEAALPKLPEIFTKADLVRALGYQPARGTLLRIFDKLLLEHRIAVVEASDGGRPTTYRKVPAP